MAGRTGGWAWAVYLVSGLAVVGGYYVASAFGVPALVRVLIYSLVSTSSAVAVLYGCRRHRPVPALPWVLLGLGELIYAAADTSFYVSHYIVGDIRYPA